MGQYWKAVNLEKQEFIKPESSLKLWEHLANPEMGQMLVVLLAAMPERRGGGDLKPNPVIGRWAGDRVVLIGGYAEDGDFPAKAGDIPQSELYGLATKKPDKPGRVPQFKDITADVVRVIKAELPEED